VTDVSPYVAAVRVWERHNGRRLTADESKAFSRSWDVYCSERRASYGWRQVPELTAEDGDLFGRRWTPPWAEEGPQP